MVPTLHKLIELFTKYTRRKIDLFGYLYSSLSLIFSLMIAYSTTITMTYPYAEILAIIFSFAAFRLFDIWKPSTIGWIDRELKGVMGVMLDDVLAGVAGCLLSAIVLMGIGKLF